LSENATLLGGAGLGRDPSSISEKAPLKNLLPEEAKTNTKKKLSKTAQEFFQSPACKQNTSKLLLLPWPRRYVNYGDSGRTVSSNNNNTAKKTKIQQAATRVKLQLGQLTAPEKRKKKPPKKRLKRETA
jgi:hypothetical protein